MYKELNIFIVLMKERKKERKDPSIIIYYLKIINTPKTYKVLLGTS